jgi:hypothetical protein
VAFSGRCFVRPSPVVADYLDAKLAGWPTGLRRNSRLCETSWQNREERTASRQMVSEIPLADAELPLVSFDDACSQTFKVALIFGPPKRLINHLNCFLLPPSGG